MGLLAYQIGKVQFQNIGVYAIDQEIPLLNFFLTETTTLRMQIYKW